LFTLAEFRAGKFSLPSSEADELPPCCSACLYLLAEEAGLCFCDSPFYYLCAYSWPDKLTQTVPPCLKEST